WYRPPRRRPSGAYHLHLARTCERARPKSLSRTGRSSSKWPRERSYCSKLAITRPTLLAPSVRSLRCALSDQRGRARSRCITESPGFQVELESCREVARRSHTAAADSLLNGLPPAIALVESLGQSPIVRLRSRKIRFIGCQPFLLAGSPPNAKFSTALPD